MNDEELEAGDFASWLDGIRERHDAVVPCDECTACCESSQFVHVDPTEADTLAHIPAELLFPAPGLPSGHVVMGYDEQGRCPMLVDGACSIYEHRPRACRTYDCRVFAATGIDSEKPLVDRRVRRWRFSFATPAARDRYEAVQVRVRQLRARGGSPTQLALMALSDRSSEEGASR